MLSLLILAANEPKTWSPEWVAGVVMGVIASLTKLSPAIGARAMALWTAVIGLIVGPVATVIQSNQAIVSWLSARSTLVAWFVALVAYFTTAPALGRFVAARRKTG